MDTKEAVDILGDKLGLNTLCTSLYIEAWQTLKTAVLAQRSHNKRDMARKPRPKSAKRLLHIA